MDLGEDCAAAYIGKKQSLWFEVNDFFFLQILNVFCIVRMMPHISLVLIFRHFYKNLLKL